MADIKKELNDIKNAVYGKEVRGSIHDGIKKINDEAENATDLSESAKHQVENIQQQVNQLVVEGDSSVEAAQARVDAEGKSYPTLKARLDEKETQFSSQLAQTVEDGFYNSLTPTRKRKPVISFIDDDGNVAVMQKLKPILEEYDIPITFALITSRIGETGDFPPTITMDDVKELEKLGAEFVSHTHTHPYLTQLTESEIEDELKKSREWLVERGYNADALVYPFGSHNSAVMDIVAKYYKVAIDIDVDSSVNYPPLNSFRLDRVYVDTKGVANAKAKIDEVIENNGWLIFGMHCWNWDALGFTMDDFREVIDYAISKGVEIVTVKEGLRSHGNYIEIGKGSSLLRDGIVFDAEGNVHGRNVDNKYVVLHRDVAMTLTNNTPINEFKEEAVSVCYIITSVASEGGFPSNSPGILETYRFYSDQYGYQIYRFLNSDMVVMRKWNTVNDSWGEWKPYNGVLYKDLDSISSDRNPNHLLPSERLNLIVSRVSSSSSEGYPAPGTLYYSPLGLNGYAHQLLVAHSTGNIYIRVWSGSSWSEWEEIQKGGGFRRKFGTDFDSPPISYANNSISYVKIFLGHHDISNAPENSPGILITYRTDDDAYTYQEYRLYRSNKVYRRYWDTSVDSWSEFELL